MENKDLTDKEIQVPIFLMPGVKYNLKGDWFTVSKAMYYRVAFKEGAVFVTPTPQRSHVEHYLERGRIEEQENWRQIWISNPFLKFPPGWEISIGPPFSGATARFRVRRETTPVDNFVSVYLDHYDRLGCFGSPYWEVYPYSEDDSIARCDINETTELIELIGTALEYLEKRPSKGPGSETP